MEEVNRVVAAMLDTRVAEKIAVEANLNNTTRS
jgi:hypothetical protein